jgi:hypothetical protein
MSDSASSSRRVVRVAVALSFLATLASAFAPLAPGAVYYGRRDALDAAFPDADSIGDERFFLTEEQRKAVEKAASAPLKERMITVHEAYRDGKIVGRAFFDTHEVRTLPETLLVVVSPEGVVEKVLLAAFYEPTEYEAPAAWRAQFEGARLEPDLRVNRKIQGIAGATLTAHAVTSGIRRVLGLHRILFEEQPSTEGE